MFDLLVFSLISTSQTPELIAVKNIPFNKIKINTEATKQVESESKEQPQKTDELSNTTQLDGVMNCNNIGYSLVMNNQIVKSETVLSYCSKDPAKLKYFQEKSRYILLDKTLDNTGKCINFKFTFQVDQIANKETSSLQICLTNTSKVEMDKAIKTFEMRTLHKSTELPTIDLDDLPSSQ
ncbi:hypothetical protein HC766_06120 [Candidatus Gracilibacteria bacterium]|nr:hypothetical protein [Candidatus Gracilibacteria bacterium]NJS41862.1 hypothetical protein [Candidatus Gracilibacteria bacterium]